MDAGSIARAVSAQARFKERKKAQIHILEPFLFIAAFLRDCPFLATAVNIHISDFRSRLISSPIH
jgi:hypothetical protein